MNFFLKNIVFNKHIKYKRYNNKFLNSIIEYFLQKSYPEVLNASKSIKLNKKNTLNINDFGIKIYSQNEEDGIILYLLKHIGIKTKKFIEIGIQDGTECNTTNLLKNFSWSGTQIEGSQKFYLKAKYKLGKILGKKIKNLNLLNIFVTRNNINKTIKKLVPNNIDLLSIDIDGNDFWIWKSIKCIRPRLVIIEYNSFFGSKISATIKYKSNFLWDIENKKSYYGASLKALEKLGKKKKYVLAGVDQNGVNAFFVRSDIAKKINLIPKKVGDVFIDNKRECRNKKQYAIESEKLKKRKIIKI